MGRRIAGTGLVAALAIAAPAQADVDLLSESTLRVGPTAGMAVVGDVNGDGVDDLATGDPIDANLDFRGSVRVVFGRAGLTAVSLTRPGPAGFTIRGERSEDRAGARVAPAGDFNGDGIDDLVLTAADGEPLTRPIPNRRFRTGIQGAAYVVFGSRTPTDVSLGDLGSRGLTIAGGVDGDATGVGDFDGDGRDDVAVGADPRAGEPGVYVVSGRAAGGRLDLAELGPGGVELGAAPGDLELGDSIDGVGDFNGDGLADLAIGVPNSLGRPESDLDSEPIGPGAAYVVFGSRDRSRVSLGRLGARGLRLDLPRGGYGTLGADVAGAGDVDGDGRPDVAVGAPTYPWDLRPRLRMGPGAVFVVRGGSAPGRLTLGRGDPRAVELRGEPAHQHFGWALAGGDVDGDGLADLLVGAPGADSATASEWRPAGAAYLVAGRRPGAAWRLAVATVRLFGSLGDAAGSQVALGDLNADRRVESLVHARPCGGAGPVTVDPYPEPGAELRLPGTMLGYSAGSPPPPPGVGAPNRLRGTRGPDRLVGTPRGDLVQSYGGNDRVATGAGGDCLFGGSGADRLDGGTGGDAIVAGPGRDVVRGGSGSDHLSAGPSGDSLDGGAGSDHVAGQAGDDGLRGGSGDDFLSAERGDDRAAAGPGDDYVEGGRGDDRIAGGLGIDVLNGGLGRDRLAGDAGGDHLYGEAGGDALRGGGGGDLLEGGGDGDAIFGGPGRDAIDADDDRRDVVDCGPGADAAVVDAADVVRGCEIAVASERALRAIPRSRLPAAARYVMRRGPSG